MLDGEARGGCNSRQRSAHGIKSQQRASASEAVDWL